MRPLPLAAAAILLPFAALAQDDPAPAGETEPEGPAAEAVEVPPQMGGHPLPERGSQRPARRGAPGDADGDRMRDMLQAHHGIGGNARFSLTSGDRTLRIDCGETAIDDCIAGAAPLIDLMR